MSAFVLRITDDSTGLSGAMRLHDGDDRSVSLGELLDRRFRFWDGSDRAVSVLPDHELALRSMQDLVYDCGPHGDVLGLRPGVKFWMDFKPVGLGEMVSVSGAHADGVGFDFADLYVDRSGDDYTRDWDTFYSRRWCLCPDAYESFVNDAVLGIHGQRFDAVMRRDSTERRIDFLRALSYRVSGSGFENYSRFVEGGLNFRTGDQTVLNMLEGGGGICAEKVQALKFLTDRYGFESEYVLAGPWARGKVPEDRLRELLMTFDLRFSKRDMRYWQHLALLYWVDGVPILVDATGGCLPFVFRAGGCAIRHLEGDEPMPVCMVGMNEDYYYHRVSQDIPHDLFIALECRVEGSDMVQVFDNDLGLYLSDRFYVMPLLHRSSAELDRLTESYSDYCDRVGLDFDVLPDWSFDGPVGRRFVEAEPVVAERVLSCRRRFLDRCGWWMDAKCDVGMVVVNFGAV